jgi:hypothetical protein
MPTRVYRILFVFGARFDASAVLLWDLLTTVLFQPSIRPWITLVRTHFHAFQNPVACEEDREALRRHSAGYADIISSCHSLCHIDNPSGNEVSRAASRSVLFQNLFGPAYIPDNLFTITHRMAQYKTKPEILAELRALADAVGSVEGLPSTRGWRCVEGYSLCRGV